MCIYWSRLLKMVAESKILIFSLMNWSCRWNLACSHFTCICFWWYRNFNFFGKKCGDDVEVVQCPFKKKKIANPDFSFSQLCMTFFLSQWIYCNTWNWNNEWLCFLCGAGNSLYPDQGTTNLHLDISDAVNVMVHVAVPKADPVSDITQEDLEQGKIISTAFK